MAELKFDGAVEGISERQLEFVRSVLDNRGYKTEQVQVSAVGKADDNYMSNVKRFEVEKDGEIFKMIAKLAPTSEQFRSRVPTEILFRNEHIIYTRVLPKFTEIEKRANIPENERLRYPICYGSLCEAPNEIILIEDLEPSNFVMFNKQNPLPCDTVKIVLKNMAKYHCLSYVLNHQEPETYEEFKNQLVNTWAISSEQENFHDFLSELEDDILSVLDSDKQRNIVKGLLTNLSDNAAENCDIDKTSRYAVFQHGDAWTNNFLFRLEGEKATECIFIDYQIASHSSPVIDIMFMILISTDYETRSKYYSKLIDYYYTELDTCLGNFGLSADVNYPRKQFDCDLRRCAKFSLGLSIMFSSFLMRDSDDAAAMKARIESDDMNNEDLRNASNFLSITESSLNRLKAKIRGLMASVDEIGYW